MNKLLPRNTTQIPVIGTLLSKTGKPWYRFLRRTFLREVSKSDISEEDLPEEDISETGISEEDIPEKDISKFLVDISNLIAMNKLYLHTNLCSLVTKRYDNLLSDFVERCDFTLNLLLLIYSSFSSVSLSQSDVPNSLIIQLSHHIGSFFNHQPFLFGIAFHSSVMSLLSFGFMQRKRENCNKTCKIIHSYLIDIFF